ncbi:MAG: DUF2232 domain-containing protein [Erysipelotrichaceae bacterium]|nr:DUF2232 domain-containing protein [Erysipelotrichaceae bacterium]
MNKTKKMTQGAMMLAIFGALVLIDRITAFLFTELVVLVVPIIVIMYSAMHTVKDGIILSVGILILSFILGNLYTSYLVFVPVGVVTGILYSYFLNKNCNKSLLLFVAIITYVACEILVCLVIYPLLGMPFASQLQELSEVFNQMSQAGGINYQSVFEQMGVNFTVLLTIMFIFSTILTGAMEGVIIHLLSIFLLKRFKIKDVENTNIYNIKPNPVLAYISFLSLFSLFLNRYFTNDVLKYISIVVSMFGLIVLLFYGYLFLTIYGKLVMKKNIGTIVVLLSLFIPAILVAVIIIGFLYGAGPLRKKLEELVGGNNE